MTEQTSQPEQQARSPASRARRLGILACLLAIGGAVLTHKLGGKAALAVGGAALLLSGAGAYLRHLPRIRHHFNDGRRPKVPRQRRERRASRQGASRGPGGSRAVRGAGRPALHRGSRSGSRPARSGGRSGTLSGTRSGSSPRRRGSPGRASGTHRPGTPRRSVPPRGTLAQRRAAGTAGRNTGRHGLFRRRARTGTSTARGTGPGGRKRSGTAPGSGGRTRSGGTRPTSRQRIASRRARRAQGSTSRGRGRRGQKGTRPGSRANGGVNQGHRRGARRGGQRGPASAPQPRTYGYRRRGPFGWFRHRGPMPPPKGKVRRHRGAHQGTRGAFVWSQRQGRYVFSKNRFRGRHRWHPPWRRKPKRYRAKQPVRPAPWQRHPRVAAMGRWYRRTRGRHGARYAHVRGSLLSWHHKARASRAWRDMRSMALFFGLIEDKTKPRRPPYRYKTYHIKKDVWTGPDAPSMPRPSPARTAGTPRPASWSRPHPSTASKSAGGHPMASSPIPAMTEAVQDGFGNWDPQGPTEMIDFFNEMPGFFGEVARNINNLAERAEGELPLDPKVTEALREIAATFGGLRDQADELNGVFRTVHEKEIERAENPRIGEQKWDVSND